MRKVNVADATAHRCVGVGPTVGGVKERWVCRSMANAT